MDWKSRGCQVRGYLHRAGSNGRCGKGLGYDRREHLMMEGRKRESMAWSVACQVSGKLSHGCRENKDKSVKKPTLLGLALSQHASCLGLFSLEKRRLRRALIGYHSQHIPKGKTQRRQTFFSSVQCWNERQWAQTGTKEVPSEHQEELCCAR